MQRGILDLLANNRLDPRSLSMFNNLLPISSTGFVQPQIQALPYDDSDDAPSFEHRQLQEEVTRLRAQEAQRVSNERAAAENAARRAERERERAQMRAELEAELRSKAAALKPSRPRHAQSTDSGRHRHFPTPVSRSGHAHFILSLKHFILFLGSVSPASTRRRSSDGTHSIAMVILHIECLCVLRLR